MSKPGWKETEYMQCSECGGCDGSGDTQWKSKRKGARKGGEGAVAMFRAPSTLIGLGSTRPAAESKHYIDCYHHR